jgi:membrane-associated phospholipid phosphatase
MTGLEEPTQANVLYGDEGNVISFKAQDTGPNLFQIKPTLSTYLNGPNVFQYNVGLLATYDRELAERLFLNTGVTFTLYENISESTGANNSTLPHVRSDLPEYTGGPRLKLDHLLLNQVYHLSERTYARVSGGWIEQMYGGLEGQWMYVERGEPWAFDVSVDDVRQRAFDGGFGFLDYQTVTALAAFHYKLPYQSTFTVRAGRFLARDYGARFEIKRRFRSGMELGAWFTATNAVDTGVGDGNYRDKGVFVSIPFEALLPADTRAVGGFSIAPWTRDAGQMVNSPVDLYRTLEKPLMLDMHNGDGLVRLGDMEDDYNLPTLGDPMWDRPFENLGTMTVQDWGHGAGEFGNPGTPGKVLLGAGVVLASAAFDRKVDNFIQNHEGSRAVEVATSMGKYLPLAAIGGAGLAALSEQDKRLSDTGIAALQAAATGVFVNVGVKYAVGRARPLDNLGPADFDPFRRPDASFPSNHVTATWAAVTPFATEYDVPWLYGVAALSNVGRVASREHWLSDTVASSVLGYAIGNFFWEQRRKPDDKRPTFEVGPNGVAVKWVTK